MKRRHQWRTLSTERDITATKIPDNGDACTGNDLIVITNLQSMGSRALWFMPDRLTVAAYCHDILRL